MITTLLLAANLIANGDFEAKFDPAEFRTMSDWLLDRDNGQGRWSQFTEDATWNKCLRIELGKIGDHVTYGVALGGEGKTAGFPVKPDTEYRLVFEARGEAARFFNGVRQIGGKGVKDIRLKTSMPANAAQKEWTKYSGTFRTQAGAERATLEFYFWGKGRGKGHNADYQEAPGQYVLIDNVVVEEVKKSVIGRTAAGNAAAPELPEVSAKAFVFKDATPLGDFVNAVKSREAAHHQVKAKAVATAEGIGFDCELAGPLLMKGVNGDGTNDIWQDDTLEFFFGSPDPANPIRQFVVSAGGARYCVEGDDYQGWNARTERVGDGWKAKVFFTWKSLGFDRAPDSATPVKFNIFSTRFVETVPGRFRDIDWSRGNGQRKCVLTDAVSLTGAEGRFRDTSLWPVFFMGSMDAFAEKSLAALTEPETTKLAAKLDRGDPSKCYSTLLALVALNREVKLSKEKYIVTQVPVTTDTTIPYLPEELNDPKPVIRARAAVNDRAVMLVAVANMQKFSDEFRVWLEYAMEQFPGSDVYPLEGLKSAVGDVIDMSRIELRRGVKYRDSDAKERGCRYDPMELMGEASSIAVPSKEAGLLALVVDCRGVKPGLYRGWLGITSLAGGSYTGVRYYNPEKGKVRRLYEIKDDSKFVEVELEVLPFELKADPARMTMDCYKALYRDYQLEFAKKWDMSGRMITPWAFKCPYDGEGRRLEDSEAAWLGEILGQYRAATVERPGERPYFIGYSVYSVYKRACRGMKEKAKVAVDDEGHWKGFADWIRYIDTVLAKHGIRREFTRWEILDEPMDKNWDHAEVVKAFRTAREAISDLHLVSTYGEIEFFDELAPILDSWIFQASSFDNAEYRRRIEAYRKLPGKSTATYRCSTSPRLDPYSYYRLLAWNSAAAGGSVSHIYQLYDGETAANLRKCTYGGITYDTGHSLVPSIRFLQYQQGLGDVRYLKELEALARGRDTSAAKEALDFVAKAYREAVLVHPHDTSAADRLRDGAIERLLNLISK